MDQKPLLFILEDDANLVQEVSELAEESGWEVIAARSVEEAVQNAEANKEHVRVAFIDMMVPRTKTECDELDKQMQLREQEVMKHSKSRKLSEISEDQLRAARDILVAIDLKIQPLVDMNGGVEFLKKSNSQITKWVIVIFTARTPGSDSELSKLSRENNWIWLQKPIDPDELIAILNQNK